MLPAERSSGPAVV